MAISLSTPVSPAPSPWQIDHSTPLLLLGSCFSQEVGSRMAAGGLNVLCNPFGTLYNPLSILRCLTLATQGQTITPQHLIQHDGVWHSWLHHSQFSHPDMQQTLHACNQAVEQTRAFILQQPTVIITLGTAYAFYLQPNPQVGANMENQVVANCHKLPAQWFLRKRLTVSEVAAALMQMAQALPQSRILFTVSPIRHMADGAHGNQLSKSTLLLGIDQAISQSHLCSYFPSYEIILDELRDYRFFARDLCHPSDLATDIVWQKFQDTYMSAATRQQLRLCEKKHKQMMHRPLIESRV